MGLNGVNPSEQWFCWMRFVSSNLYNSNAIDAAVQSKGFVQNENR